MKFIAYILIAANVALAAFYFSTQTDAANAEQTPVFATLSNLSIKTQPKRTDTAPTESTPIASPSPVTTDPVIASTPPPEPEPITQPTQAQYCIEISQIIEESTALGIQEFLTDQQISFETEAREVLIKTVYSILIGPFSSTNRTKLEIKNLKADNIDYYILPNEPNKGAISLGLYSNKKGAEGEVAKFLAKDYDVRLEEKDTYKTQYFINIPASSAQKLNDNLWNRLLKNFSAIKKSNKSC